MTKILVVSSKYQPDYSGSGYRAHTTYKRLKKKFNIEYDVVTNSINNKTCKMYEYEDVIVHRLCGPFEVAKYSRLMRKLAIWTNLLFEFFYTWRFIRNRWQKYDLLHTFGDSWSVAFLTFYFAYRNKPIIRELCNDIPTPFYPYWFRKWIKPIFHKNNALIVAISTMLEKLALEHKAKQVWQRPNPIDEKKFNWEIREKRYNLRNKLTEFNNDDIILVFIAGFNDGKNQKFLLHVLKQLPQKYKLILAGPLKKEHQIYYQKLCQDIDTFVLQNRVQIKTGFVNNINEYMAIADVYLFPSKHEGLGTPILEAQACGVAVVSNILPDITDKWIRDGIGGYACILDAEQWLYKIHQALNIDIQTLEKNAKNILNIAGTDKIDIHYMEKFDYLIKQENK